MPVKYYQSIHSLLEKSSNDYSSLEKNYKSKTKKALLSYSPLPLRDYKESVSIIIPTFNSKATLRLTLKSIERQCLHPTQKKRIEVIVVDDGSSDDTDVMIREEKFSLKLRYVWQKNAGRSAARNKGANMAKHTLLFFFDSDILLERHFLNEHIARHHFLKNIVLLGFKQDVSPSCDFVKYYPTRISNAKPDMSKDFRFKKTVKKEWLLIKRYVVPERIGTVRILDQTESLKKFGGNTVLGVWDLPSTVISSAISLRRSVFKKCGGFSLEFKGWGMEDCFLGACLIAHSQYIIPCFSTGVFHIDHKPRSGSRARQLAEFKRNMLVYRQLIQKTLQQL